MRRLMLGLPALVLCIALGACAQPPAGGSAASPAGGACGELQRPPVQGGGHLLGDEQPPDAYSSVPPTSGWHSSGAFDIGVHGEGDPLGEPEQVSVLEAGGVVATYRDLAPEDRAALEALARDRHAGRLAVTPYDQLEPGQIALTAWGVLQLCDGIDAGAVDAFVDAHADEHPSVGHGR